MYIIMVLNVALVALVNFTQEFRILLYIELWESLLVYARHLEQRDGDGDEWTFATDLFCEAPNVKLRLLQLFYVIGVLRDFFHDCLHVRWRWSLAMSVLTRPFTIASSLDSIVQHFTHIQVWVVAYPAESDLTRLFARRQVQLLYNIHFIYIFLPDFLHRVINFVLEFWVLQSLLYRQQQINDLLSWCQFLVQDTFLFGVMPRNR